jgi:hypothetical protein
MKVYYPDITHPARVNTEVARQVNPKIDGRSICCRIALIVVTTSNIRGLRTPCL